MKKTILVVEDDPAVQRGLRENLEREGYHVLVARDGVAGLAIARRQSPQLAILDVMLPSMSGFELCSRMKKSGFSAPIFLLTGLTDERSRLEGLGTGADDYIQKPFSIGELVLRVRNAFDRSERLFGKAKILEEELLKARDIQLSSLPKEPPRIPGLDVYGMMRPATHVGGDYFDFVRLGPKKLAVLVADVSGKGMPAAIYVHTMQGIVRASLGAIRTAQDLLGQLQTHLGKAMEISSYVTGVAALFDLERGTLEIASAGHLPVLLKRGTTVQRLHPEGFVIGQIADERFYQALRPLTATLRSGDILIFFTDGIVESFDEKGEEFGLRRLEQYAASSSGTARRVVERCFANVDRFAADAPQSDDMTVVSVKILQERTHV